MEHRGRHARQRWPRGRVPLRPSKRTRISIGCGSKNPEAPIEDIPRAHIPRPGFSMSYSKLQPLARNGRRLGL